MGWHLHADSVTVRKKGIVNQMFHFHSPSCFLLPISTWGTMGQTHEADWGARSNLQCVDYSYSSSLPHKMVHARKPHTFIHQLCLESLIVPLLKEELETWHHSSREEREQGETQRDILIWKSDIKEINCIAVYIADTSPQLLSHHGDSVCALPAEIHAPRTPMPLCPHRLTGRSLSQPGRAPFKQHVAHLDSRKQYQMLGRDFLQCAATGGGEGRQYVFQRNEIQKWTLRAGVVSNTANTGHSGQPGDWGDGITRDQAHSPRRGPHDICQTQEDISYVLQVLLHL